VRFFDLFFSDKAIVDCDLMAYLNPAFKGILLYYFTENWQIDCIFIIALIAYLCILLGYKTRIAIAVAVAFICLFNFYERNRMFPIGGSDDILRLCLFWSFFLPLNRHYVFQESKRRAWIYRN
jgi:hypothetical protein